MRNAAQKLAIYSMLASLALALSYAENAFPLSLFVPLPGIKLGLANIVSLFALYLFGTGAAFSILIVRCLLGALFAGNASALIFSLFGGILSMAVMALLHRNRLFSIFGVSIAGAAAHNLGQTGAAILVLGGSAPLKYLPPLLIVALFSGTLIGFICSSLLQATRTIPVFHTDS